MSRRILFAACVAVLVLAACGSDKKSTSASSAASGGSSSSSSSGSAKGPTIQVDNTSKEVNFESTAYYPKAATVAAGTTITFHSNFEGEPHTVTFGSSIDAALKVLDALPPEQQQGPPPPEVAALKIPFVIPDDADFSDPASVQFNQSAAQPCVVKAGEFAPGAAPCPTKKAEAFDGTQALYNSGLMKADQNFEVKLADNIKPGVYQYVCLFHGPEMAGKVTVVAKGDAAAQDNAAVQAAGKQQLDDDV